eukprot:scaffold31923_cov112-Isochrysis_galbana.AAC.5
MEQCASWRRERWHATASLGWVWRCISRAGPEGITFGKSQCRPKFCCSGRLARAGRPNPPFFFFFGRGGQTLPFSSSLGEVASDGASQTRVYLAV